MTKNADGGPLCCDVLRRLDRMMTFGRHALGTDIDKLTPSKFHASVLHAFKCEPTTCEKCDRYKYVYSGNLWLEYRSGMDPISASLAAMSRDVVQRSPLLASSSNSPMREALIPGGPITRMTVINLREWRTLAVILSSDRLIAIASKPTFRAISSMQSRVRIAVFPDRHIKTPKPISASKASSDSVEAALRSVSSDEFTSGFPLLRPVWSTR